MNKDTEGRPSICTEVARAPMVAHNQEPFLENNPESISTARMQDTRKPRWTPPKPALEAPRPDILQSYITEVDVDCDDCGGSGFDPGGIDPWGPDMCPKCHGAKTQTISRNYLAEAFRIAANPESTRPVERAHLVAIVQYCREAVSAIVGLPEIYERPKTAEPTTSSRHSRSRSQSHTVTHIKRRKRNVDISPQRARSRKRAAAGG